MTVPEVFHAQETQRGIQTLSKIWSLEYALSLIHSDISVLFIWLTRHTIMMLLTGPSELMCTTENVSCQPRRQPGAEKGCTHGRASEGMSFSKGGTSMDAAARALGKGCRRPCCSLKPPGLRSL